MSTIVDTHDEAARLDLPPLLVRRPLEAFLDERGLGSGPIEAMTVGEGHSNVTYLIRRDGGEWVLRRPPRPPLPPSAHDVLREARLLLAVSDQPVRTPRVLATCDDPDVIGAPFYVMERVQGDVITTAIPDALDTPEQRRRIADELIDSLVEIHAVPWEACGLEGYGKPTGYLDRQLRRFGGLWEHNKTREVEVLDRVTAWLGDHKPESPAATIVHGDYRLGNTMFALETPARLVAIFDWELSTIGDPLADLGYMTVTWIEPGDSDDTMFSSLTAVTRAGGFPSRDELIELYEERTGRPVGNLRWYQTLALWKAAVFMEGNYKRFSQGMSDDEYLGLFDEGVPALAEAAWEIANAPAPS